MPGNEWATMDTVLPEKDLHVKGSIIKGADHKFVFWMFNPPTISPCRVRCGLCRRGMDGYGHCPNCFPTEESVRVVESRRQP